MRIRIAASCVLVLAAAVVPAFAQTQQPTAPESFTANLQAAGAQGGAAAAVITVEVSRYTPEPERVAVEKALKSGGYPAFLAALRRAPAVGAVKFGEKAWTIRWARESKDEKGARTLTYVTDSPIFFVGGGAVDAKPRQGYEVGLIQFKVDPVGLGSGTMAAAARVRPDGQGGVEIDDYADKPIILKSVVRQFK